MMGSYRNHDVVDQRLLDRLVDGELSDEQERAVIARLEDTPDGWRRCALAFLESRCWQRAADAVTRQGDGEPRPAAAQQTSSAWRAQPWTWVLALAAVFLVAFGVGTFLPRAGSRSSRMEVAQPAAPALRPSPALAQVERPADQSVTDRVGPAGDLYLGNLKLVNDSGSEIDVPVYDWNQQVAEELMYRSQPLSPDLARQLKRHQVRSSRSYLPVRLEDGRQIVLPVQEVDITPVGGTAY
jgi:hypothetical protein